MAQLRNAAQMYQQGSVKTASPAKLTLMLYEGAIRFCNIAKEAIEAEEFEKAPVPVPAAWPCGAEPAALFSPGALPPAAGAAREKRQPPGGEPPSAGPSLCGEAG